MSTDAASWAFVLGAVFVVAAAFAIQRHLERRYIRSQEALRDAAYERRPIVALSRDLEAEWNRLAPLYDLADAGMESDRGTA